MSTAVIRYKAKDGSEWETEAKADTRDALIAECEAAHAILGPPRQLGPDDFIEHPADAMAAFIAAVQALARKHTAWYDGWAKWSADTVAHPRSIIGRIIDDGNVEPLRKLWWRYGTIHGTREYQQPFFAIQAEESSR